MNKSVVKEHEVDVVENSIGANNWVSGRITTQTISNNDRDAGRVNDEMAVSIHLDDENNATIGLVRNIHTYLGESWDSIFRHQVLLNYEAFTVDELRVIAQALELFLAEHSFTSQVG